MVLNLSFCYVQWVGTSGMTMFWTGGSTKMTAMSCFLNMKIYKRFVVVRPVFWSVSRSAVGKRIHVRF